MERVTTFAFGTLVFGAVLYFAGYMSASAAAAVPPGADLTERIYEALKRDSEIFLVKQRDSNTLEVRYQVRDYEVTVRPR